jgi:hypothetical protein
MLFDYFDVETFYKDTRKDNRKDTRKDNRKDIEQDNRKTIIKLQPGLTIIRHGRIVQAQEKKQ